jgi:hypothetical protein
MVFKVFAPLIVWPVRQLGHDRLHPDLKVELDDIVKDQNGKII